MEAERPVAAEPPRGAGATHEHHVELAPEAPVQLPDPVAVLPDPKEDTRGATLLRPRRLPEIHERRYASLLLERRHRTLGSRDLWAQVRLPPGASEEEWLAVTTIEIFEELNLLVGALSDMCTEKNCPQMKAGKWVYKWADGERVTTPIELSAPKYFENLLTWVERQLADEKFLPVELGVPFPRDYRKGLRVIYKRLFRIYAHIYHEHYKELSAVDSDAHVNHSFKHFIYFVKEFRLIDDEELEPMKDLIDILMGNAVHLEGIEA